MNHEQATTVARAINVVRPTWHPRSTTTIVMRDHAQRSMRDVFIALAIAATDPDARTPAVINEGDFPGWRVAEALHLDGLTPTERPHPSPPTAAEQCPIHHGYRHDNCGGCRADELAVTVLRDTEPDEQNAPDMTRLHEILQRATHHHLDRSGLRHEHEQTPADQEANSQ